MMCVYYALVVSEKIV